MSTEEELIPRLVELYHRMDDAYSAVAEKVGLTCEGCDGVKCCTVDLTLHTFMEMHYLRRGFDSLNDAAQLAILDRCRTILKAKQQDPWGEAYRESVCALNLHGSCILYAHRPMICRLAGLPHFFVRPDGSQKHSGGCTTFQNKIDTLHPELEIDRTDFYRGMAELEMEASLQRGQRTSPRTIAETLCL
ncbi:MAG: hypothetical protein HY914_04840 [Desulfomonile tiedjei]|nr:hypothetical protein [Desulfomonile tiedjei]